MRIATNEGTGAGPSVPFHAEPSRPRTVLVWGTVTDVDLEISPDAGATWIALQNFTAAGTAQVNLGGETGYYVRVNVTTGSGVYLDIL